MHRFTIIPHKKSKTVAFSKVVCDLEDIMNLEALVQQYGYLAIFVGTLLEGETVLVLGGFLAHQGYLELPFVMLAAFLGGFSGDSIFFTLGKVKGAAFLERHEKFRRATARARGLVHKYGHLLLPVYRFLYGLRTALPFVFGMNRMSSFKFFGVVSMSACVWAIIVGSAGYFFGSAVNLVIADIKKYQMWIIAGFIVIAALAWIFRFVHLKLGKDSANSDSL